MSDQRPDVEIGEVNTRIEVTDTGAQGMGDMNKLADLVMRRIREMRDHEAMRDADGRIRDRSWTSDVKPD